VPCFGGTWLVYAGFLASLGLYFSVIKRTSLRAIFWTLLALLGLSVAVPLAIYDLPDTWLTEFEKHSLLPPLALGLVAFSFDDLMHWLTPEVDVRFWPLAVSLVVWSLFTWALWALAGYAYRR